MLSKNKRDFESEGAYSQAEDLISDLTTSNESLFEMELYFLPKSNSLESLNLLTFDLIDSGSVKNLPNVIGEVSSPFVNKQGHADDNSNDFHLLLKNPPNCKFHVVRICRSCFARNLL